MAVSFDPTTGLTIQSTAEIRETVQNDWITAFSGASASALSVDPETPAGQLIDTETALIAQKDADLLYLSNMFNPVTAQGKWQDALGKIYFLTRKTAAATVVQCQCTGLKNTIIPKGAIVESTNGDRLESLERGIIPDSGTIAISFQCQETGAISIGANSVTKIITVIPGWDSVNNSAAGATGNDEETQAEFEARRYASVAKNSHGSVSSIYSELAAIDGVIDLDILENSTSSATTISGVSVDAHSIAICIYGGANTEIAKGIYYKKDAGCGTSGNTTVSYTDDEYYGVSYSYSIVRPTATAVKISVIINATSGASSQLASDIKQAIYEDFYGQGDNERAGLNQTLYASRFYPPAINAGAIRLVSLQIALGSGSLGESITINADIEPTLALSDITVTIQS